MLNVNNDKKHAVRIIIKIMITASIPLELKSGHVTAQRSTHMLILAIYQL